MLIIRKPYYQVREFTNNSFILNEYEIEPQVLNELVKRDLGKWKHVFLEQINEIEKISKFL